ncbi:hypothetical protein GCM10020220_028720 [Nonomuraea rubra]
MGGEHVPDRAFPTDRPGVPLSLSGGIHRYAAFAAFLVMPVAGLLLARAKIRYAGAMRVLSGLALAALVLVVIPYVVRMFGIPLSNDGHPGGGDPAGRGRDRAGRAGTGRAVAAQPVGPARGVAGHGVSSHQA